MWYMKQFKLLILLLVIGLVGEAQINYLPIKSRYKLIAGLFDSTLHIPSGTTPGLRTGGYDYRGAVFYKTSDSTVYVYTGTQWISVKGSGGGGSADSTIFATLYRVDTAKNNMTLQRVVNNGRQADSIFIDNGTAGEKFAIRNRNVGIGFPVTTIKPTTANKNIAFDIMPTGNPGNYSDNGIAWIDVCDADVSAGAGNVGAARVGITSSSVQFGSRAFGTTVKPVHLIVNTDSKVILNTNNTADFNIGKINQSQSLSGDYVGYTLFNTNNSVAESNPIFFIGNDFASNRFGYLRWNNGATSSGFREPNQLEIISNAAGSGGIAIGSLGATSLIKFVGLGGTEFARFKEWKLGLWEASPDSVLTVGLGAYFKGGVRMSNLPIGGGETDSVLVIGSDGSVKKRNASSFGGGGSSDTSTFIVDTTYAPIATVINTDSIRLKSIEVQYNGVPIPPTETDSTLIVNIVPTDTTTVPLMTFSAGAGFVADTSMVTDSSIFGSLFTGQYEYTIKQIQAVIKGDSGDSIVVKIVYNDSFNVDGTKINAAGLSISNRFTGDQFTISTNRTIPVNSWLWVKPESVITGKKPKYVSITLLGYKTYIAP